MIDNWLTYVNVGSVLGGQMTEWLRKIFHEPYVWSVYILMETLYGTDIVVHVWL